MPTGKKTFSVRMDEAARRRVEMAAKVLRQSSGAFLEKAGQDRARRVLLDWAVEQHRQGHASFSELAEQTGLAVEEIMECAGTTGREQALDMFLAACETVAETQGNQEFLRTAQEATRVVGNRER